MKNLENNKLIAEFMGLTIITDGISLFDTNYKPLKDYHADWNWLMEVVEKIEYVLPLFPNDNSFNVTIGSTKYCVIQDSNGELVEFIGQEKTRILSVYKAVVEFIKWYNQNK